MVAVMTQGLIGTTEAAERCGVERSTFFRWVQLGRIVPAAKMRGDTGAYLFRPEDVDALIAEQATA